MPPTPPSLTAYRTALQALSAAIAARNWAEAWAQLAVAKALRAGLADAASADGAGFSLGSLDALEATLTAAELRANRAAGRGRRLIRTSTRHAGSPSPRRARSARGPHAR